MVIWKTAKIIKKKKWTKRLFSIILHADISPFLAGQFAKLAILQKNNKYIKRVYSYVNPPKSKNLEFFITHIPNGIMSKLLYKLIPGDEILISKQSSGFFTIYEIPKCEILWMFATGTAIGPFCSILQDGSKLDQFEKIIIIYAVKYTEELIYLPLIKNIQKKYEKKIIIQTITSQEKNSSSLQGRIPTLLKNQLIETTVGHILHPQTSHVMLCGNPAMVKETQNYLIKHRNLKKHLRRSPGNISSENYW
ncbi:FAD-binding oxidoreductase [Buchnera aphidicola]|uniref:FAD-binding oxidoreductase n=1 Tax=Buchnera aphidicola TaxID=9 RepID=UPI0031B81A5D